MMMMMMMMVGWLVDTLKRFVREKGFDRTRNTPELEERRVLYHYRAVGSNSQNSHRSNYYRIVDT